MERNVKSKLKQSFSCRNTNKIAKTIRIAQKGCKTDSRSSIQFTKPINSNYHNFAENDHVVKVQSMSLELVQSS